MASLVLTGDTSGQVTIAAPAVAGTNTLTLPALTGTILTNKTAGTVLQAVSASSSGNTTTTSTSWSDVVTASITPSSATSKIIVLANGYTGCTRNGDQLYWSARIERRISGGSTTVITPTNEQATSTAGAYSYTPSIATSRFTSAYSINKYDSPSTTSAITYAWQHANVGSMTNNQTSGVELILLEIAA
jgi:hypothetical protein